MSASAAIAQLARAVAAVLVPSRCAGCRRACGGVLCAACRDMLASAPAAGAGAVLEDAGPAARMVRIGKAGHSWQVARAMADLTIARAEAGLVELPRIDAVTWVPHDPARGARRGQHLPQLYGAALARRLGVPCGAMLQRRRGRAQRGAGLSLRQRNVRDSFRPLAGTAPAAGSLLLVDDVRTTGATLAAARAALAVDDVHGLAFVAVPRRLPLRDRPGAPIQDEVSRDPFPSPQENSSASPVSIRKQQGTSGSRDFAHVVSAGSTPAGTPDNLTHRQGSVR